LRAALAQLSKLRSGTWVAMLMGKDSRTLTVIAADVDERQLAEYAEAMYPPGAAPTLSFSQSVIETGEPILVPQVSYEEFTAMQIPAAADYFEGNKLPMAVPIARIGFVVVAMRTRDSTIGALGSFTVAPSP